MRLHGLGMCILSIMLVLGFGFYLLLVSVKLGPGTRTFLRAAR